MSLKQITAEEALRKAAAGKNVYILQPISEKTTVAELFNALAFAEKIQEEEKPEEDPKEEVAEREEAPATKRKRGLPARIDRDKVKALFAAGWSIENIAKEMGASDAIIRGITMAEDL